MCAPFLFLSLYLSFRLICSSLCWADDRFMLDWFSGIFAAHGNLFTNKIEVKPSKNHNFIMLFNENEQFLWAHERERARGRSSTKGFADWIAQWKLIAFTRCTTITTATGQWNPIKMPNSLWSPPTILDSNRQYMHGNAHCTIEYIYTMTIYFPWNRKHSNA